VNVQKKLGGALPISGEVVYVALVRFQEGFYFDGRQLEKLSRIHFLLDQLGNH
jgi:hypothetical protein